MAKSCDECGSKETIPDILTAIEGALESVFPDFISREGVLNIFIGNKIKDGKDTGVKSIVVAVKEKKEETKLSPNQLIPKQVGNFLTDIVEFKPDTWTIGETEPSKKSPSIQRRMAGGVRRS
jgi:hypothetical protein